MANVVRQYVVFQDGFDFAQGFVAFRLHNLCCVCMDEFREGDLNFSVCQHMTKDFLI